MAVELTGDSHKGSHRGIDSHKGSHRGIIGVLQGPWGVLWGDVICIVEHWWLLNSPVIPMRGPTGVLQGLYRVHGGSFGEM